MELEKLISEKIRLEELKPIRWDKERVWTHIQRDKKSPGYTVFFIAASTVLATCLIVYFIQTNLDQHMLNRIATLEFKIGQYDEIPKTIVEHTSAPLENCDEVIISPRRSVTNFENGLRSIPQTTLTPLNDSVAVTQTEILTVDPTPVSSLVIEKDLTEVMPKIEAIIGVIPADHKPMRVAKEKRLRVKFSREHEDFFSGDDPKKQVLTARIN